MKEQFARVRTEPEHKVYGELDYFEEMQEHIRDIRWCLRKVKLNEDNHLRRDLNDIAIHINLYHKARKKIARQISRDADKASAKLAKAHAKIRH